LNAELSRAARPKINSGPFSLEIALEILVIEEGGCTVDTEMGEVERHAGHFESGASRHAESRSETASNIRLGTARIHRPTSVTTSELTDSNAN